jgi:DNA (cytosine-5)-methyltransferase 1
MLTHFSLFTGIGGIDLAAERAGFETVGQCEWADYPTKVLEKHWPDVPRWRDIRGVTAESFRERTGLHTATIVSGGFPCQPFSVAGKQKGRQDDRYLWPEMLRVIRELMPSWVIGENVPGIMRIAADEVCTNLEDAGYSVGIFNFEAAAVGAMHRRERIFFVGHSEYNGLSSTAFSGIFNTPGDNNQERKIETSQFERTGKSNGNETMAYSDNQRLPSQRFEGRICKEKGEACPGIERRSLLGRERNTKRWEPEPNVGRVANGIPNRVDRLKCLGNAVVPQQVYPILQAIADAERGCSLD